MNRYNHILRYIIMIIIFIGISFIIYNFLIPKNHDDNIIIQTYFQKHSKKAYSSTNPNCIPVGGACADNQKGHCCAGSICLNNSVCTARIVL